MINILNAGNEGVFRGMLITTLSLIKHTREQINMTCFTMDLRDLNPRFAPITAAQAHYLDRLLKSANSKSRFTLIDMRQIFLDELGKSVNIATHFTPYTLLRLLADKVEMPSKYIYLDTDTIINHDIAELFDIDLDHEKGGSYELGVVRDAYRLSKTYFNAGVILFNHRYCLETGLFEKARELVNKKRMLYADQDALNRCCTKRLMLPLRFNAKDKYFEDIVVHHFCNVRKNFFHRIKPWEVDLVREKTHAYDDILDSYAHCMKEFYEGTEQKIANP